MSKATRAALALLAGALITISLLAAPGAATAAPLQLTGDLGAHDPALVAGTAGRPWYVFATGGGAGGGTITVRSSPDGRNWTYRGTIWNSKPAWITQAIPGVSNLWAPEIVLVDGVYRMYYSASTFGSQRSLIGLATNTTLDPADPAYRWVDQGKVFESFGGNPYNAIDPGVIDADGTRWMSFGSWWTGIYAIRLGSNGKPASGAQPVHLADRRPAGTSAIEAPYIVRRGAYYYLFTSFDVCCAGADSTYKIAVGRSTSVTGPYADRAGRQLLQGGGTVILARRGADVAAGGQSVSAGWIGYHTYGGYGFRLGIEWLSWTSDGWPYVSS